MKVATTKGVATMRSRRDIILSGSSVKKIRRYDIRRGNKFAPISRDDMETCQCCGRKIVKVVLLSNGCKVGAECTQLVLFPDAREKVKLTNQQRSFIEVNGN